MTGKELLDQKLRQWYHDWANDLEERAENQLDGLIADAIRAAVQEREDAICALVPKHVSPAMADELVAAIRARG